MFFIYFTHVCNMDQIGKYLRNVGKVIDVARIG